MNSSSSASGKSQPLVDAVDTGVVGRQGQVKPAVVSVQQHFQVVKPQTDVDFRIIQILGLDLEVTANGDLRAPCRAATASAHRPWPGKRIGAEKRFLADQCLNQVRINQLLLAVSRDQLRVLAREENAA